MDNSDPFIRRRTAPIKLTPKPRTALCLPDAPPGQGQGGPVPSPVRKLREVDMFLAHDAALRTPPRPQKEAPHVAHPVRVRKDLGALDLLEFKQTCKFRVEDMGEMVVTREVKVQGGGGCGSSGASASGKDKVKGAAAEDIAKAGPVNSEYREKERKEARVRKWKSRRGYFGGQQETVKVEEVGLTVKCVGDVMNYKMNGTQRKMQDVSGSYYVFVEAQDGSCYEAFPVKGWLNFDHESKVVPLSTKEAEDAFQKRNKILNHFALMINKKVRGDEEGLDESSLEGARKRSIRTMNSFDVEYMDSEPNSSDSECEENFEKKRPEDDDGVMIVNEVKSKKSKRKGRKSLKKRNQLDASFDENDQDFDSSGPESDSDVDASQSQGYQYGVDEEEGLRDILISEESESEEEKDKDKEISIVKVPKKRGRKRLPRPHEFKVTQCGVTESAPVPLVLKKAGSGDWNVSASDPEPEEQTENTGKLKLVLKRTSTQPITNGPPPKRMRENSVIFKAAKESGLTKDAVERYLVRKPMNITDLLRKFASCKKAMTVDEVTSAIGHFIRELNPRQSVVSGKIMYFIPTAEDLSSSSYFSQFGQ